MNLFQFFKENNDYSLKSEGNQYIVTPCPLCFTQNKHSNSAFFHQDKGFKCFSCDGNTRQVIDLLKNKGVIFSTNRENKKPKITYDKNYDVIINENEYILKKRDEYITKLSKNLSLERVYTNKNYKNEVLGYMLRLIDKDNNKTFRQIKLVKYEGRSLEFRVGSHRDFKDKPCLYFNKTLPKDKDTILIVEGQKCQESLESFIQKNNVNNVKALAIYGATSVDKIDYSILNTSHSIYFLQDNDEQGIKAALKLKSKLKKMGLKITIPKPLGTTKKYDIADWIQDNPKASFKDFENLINEYHIKKYNDDEMLNPLDFPNIPDVSESGYVKKIPATLSNFRFLLDSYDIHIRNNITLKRIQILREKKELEVGILKSNMNINNISTRDLQDFIETIASDNQVNEVLNYYQDCLKVWDGNKRLECFLQDIFEYEIDSNDEEEIFDLKMLYKEMLRIWLLQCIHVQTKNNAKLPVREVLVLQGNQRIGKTSFLRSLIPQEWFCEGATLDTRDKDSKLHVLRSGICEFGELGSTLASDMNRFKAFISNREDGIRPPYGKKEMVYKRNTIFCASVNESKFLKDSENTRFFILPLKNINRDIRKKYLGSKEKREQFWGEIFAQYIQYSLEDFDDLISSVVKKSSEENENYTFSYGNLDELFHKSVSKPKEHIDSIYTKEISSYELAKKLLNKEPSPSDVNKIGNLLSKKGFERKTIRMGSKRMRVYKVELSLNEE